MINSEEKYGGGVKIIKSNDSLPSIGPGPYYGCRHCPLGKNCLNCRKGRCRNCPFHNCRSCNENIYVIEGITEGQSVERFSLESEYRSNKTIIMILVVLLFIIFLIILIKLVK
jgi:hypothetical protein